MSTKKYVVILFIPLVIGLLLVLAIMNIPAVNAAALDQRQGNGSEKPETPLLTDLQVRTKMNTGAVRPGEKLTYTVSYTNTLSVDITNVLITDTFRGAYDDHGGHHLIFGQSYDCTYQSNPDIPTGQFTCSGSPTTGYSLSWQIPTLAAGSSGEIIFATELFTTPEPSINNSIILLGNAVKISAQSASGNSNDAVAMLVGPLFTISKVANPTTLLPGHMITYTLTVNNSNRSDAIPATNLIISDTLPANTTFHSASAGGHYDQALNAVIWNYPGPLNPNANYVINFVVRVDPDANPDKNISNSKTMYHVRSEEIKLSSISGYNAVNVGLDPLLQKTARAKRMSGSTAVVYPTEEVTYTLTIYNPYTTTISGVTVTDTLPGLPDPFIYQRPAPGNPAPNLVEGGRKLVWIIDLPGWGSTSRSFVVKVPQHIQFEYPKTSIVYKNSLMVDYPSFYSQRDELAPVSVEAPLIMDKTVAPSHGMPGETVVYEITLNNRGPFIISSIRLTDTLPTYFQFIHMVSGQAPLPEYNVNPVVWAGLQVPAKSSMKLSFEVSVDGYWTTTYCNNLYAYSPDVYIPPHTKDGCVYVDPPIRFNKTISLSTLMNKGELSVDAQGTPEAYVGDILHYDIQELNVDNDSTWTIYRVEDTLPYGFNQVGGSNSNPAVIVIPPYNIPPGGMWEGSFDARITNDIDCSALPKTYYNEEGYLRAYFSSPLDITVYNAVKVAPVIVNPSIQVDLIPYRYEVEAGDILTYTLNLNNVSRTPALNSTIVINLPTGFSYLGMVSGPPPSVSGLHLTWTGINISDSEQVALVFTVQVASDATLGTKTPTYSASAFNICFGKLGSGDHPLGTGKVIVDDYVLELSKTASNLKVPPLSLIDYTISINNKDYYDYPIAVVTDTLPSGFTYYSIVSGPPPTIQGNKVIWRNILIPGNGITKITIRVQTSSLYGSFYNNVDGYTPGTRIKSAVSLKVDVSPVFDLKKDAGKATVNWGQVIPYTITLVNLSDKTYSDMWITDTLPLGFDYYRTKTTTHNLIRFSADKTQVAWHIISLKTGLTLKIVFETFVRQHIPGVYYNTVIGASPSGAIPGPILTAPVTVLELPWFPIYLPVIVR